MNRVFVCHTQYNLSLASGLSSSNDDLILFKDFCLNSELEERLINHYHKCLFLEGAYPKKELSVNEKLRKIRKDNIAIRRFLTKAYSQIFIVEDMCIQEMYALKCAYRLNKNVEMSWLEDGAIAYFDNVVDSGGLGRTPFTRFIRKWFFSFFFGLYRFYDLASCMGGHKLLSSIYVLFPDSVRKELKKKNLRTITDDEFRNGMAFMYAGSIVQFTPGSTLIAMDKLEVYGDKLDIVNHLVKGIVDSTTSEVYYKYHPRETDTLPALENCTEIDRKIALESYLTNSNTKNLTVVGIKSTVLQTAKKMGFKAISMINRVDQNTAVASFYQSIGVECR